MQAALTGDCRARSSRPLTHSGATSPDAECAWVLWSSHTDGRFWRVELAHPTVRECIVEIDQRAKPLGDDRLDEGQMRHRMAPTGPLLLWSTKSDWKVKFVCLPDTVDPRGPKGK